MSKGKTTRYSSLQFKNTSPPRQQKRDKSPESSLTIGNMRRNTEMCRFVVQNKVCPFGETCLYAHSSQELIVPTRDFGYIYRTKPCAFLLENKVCPYGNKCAFQHQGIAKQLPLEPSPKNTPSKNQKNKNSNSNYHNSGGPFSIGKESLKHFTEKNRRQLPSPELEALILECSKSENVNSEIVNSNKMQIVDSTCAPNQQCNSLQPNNPWAKTEIDQVLNFQWRRDGLASTSNFALNPVALFAKIPLN